MSEWSRWLRENFDRRDHNDDILGGQVKSLLQNAIRVVFLCLCSALIGSSLMLRISAQTLTTLPERMARQEESSVVMASTLARLESDVAHEQSDIATMEGIGIGLGSALGFLQIIQMILMPKRRESA